MQLGSKELAGILEQASVSKPAPAMRQPAAARTLEEMVIQLVERLRTQPDDPQNWVLLAKSYTVLKRFGDAVGAYGNAHRLNGDQPELLADYADALVMASGGRFTDQAANLLQRALEIQPDHTKALWLSGHWKYQNGAFDEAIQYWQRVAAQVPEDSPDARVIARQIGQARQQLDMTADREMQAAVSASPPVTGSIEPAAGKVLQVRVSLDSQFSTQVDPEDTVFIFARAAEGPRMPLAIVRKQVKDLPVTVTLDDSSAMSAAMRLSGFEEVSLAARISRSGDAMPTSGDLQGTVSSVRTQGTKVIELIIDTTLP
jgi:cytochrome c-type biogenesis protein CcmH